MSASIAEDRVKGERYTGYYAERSAEQIKERCTATNPVPFEKCVEEIVTASHENQRDEADLMAQREMAQWAYVVAVIAGLSLSLTVFGIWYVRANLIEMQAQRELTANTERPQMLISELNVRGLRSPPDQSGMVTLHIDHKFTNYGRTPAVMKQERMQLEICANLSPEPQYYPLKPSKFIVSVNGWYGSLTATPVLLDADAIVRVLTGIDSMFIFGRLEYYGASKVLHKGRYAYRLIFDNADASERFFPDGPDSYWEAH